MAFIWTTATVPDFFHKLLKLVWSTENQAVYCHTQNYYVFLHLWTNLQPSEVEIAYCQPKPFLANPEENGHGNCVTCLIWLEEPLNSNHYVDLTCKNVIFSYVEPVSQDILLPVLSTNFFYHGRTQTRGQEHQCFHL